MPAKKTPIKNAGENPTRNEQSKGLTTEELTQKHLQDKNNKITDEDIRNIRIDTEVTNEDALDLPESDERPKDADKDNNKTTPWDVISE